MEVIELIVLTYFRDFIEKIDTIVCVARVRACASVSSKLLAPAMQREAILSFFSQFSCRIFPWRYHRLLRWDRQRHHLLYFPEILCHFIYLNSKQLDIAKLGIIFHESKMGRLRYNVACCQKGRPLNVSLWKKAGVISSCQKFAPNKSFKP
jgi:hypothetical protein